MLPEEIGARFAPVFSKYKIRKAILFGSACRGEMTAHSDIDLILVMDTEKRLIDRYDGILYELNGMLRGISVEPLIYTAKELEAIKGRPFIEKALREGISLYEQE